MYPAIFAGSPSGIPLYAGSTNGIPVPFQYALEKPVYTGSVTIVPIDRKQVRIASIFFYVIWYAKKSDYKYKGVIDFCPGCRVVEPWSIVEAMANNSDWNIFEITAACMGFECR